MNRNLYKIDDVLLKAGFVTGPIAVLIFFGILSEVGQKGLAFSTLLTLAVTVACPLILLSVGWSFRKQEKLLVEMWRLIEAQGQVSIDQLSGMTSYGRRQLADAVRRINQRGNGVLLWDEQARVVRDGRVQQYALTHSEDCQSCGGRINIEISTRQRDYVCPYCGAGLDCSRINPLLDNLKAREEKDRPAMRSSSAPSSSKNFSLGIFILLMVLFWPAAVLYAIKMNSG